MTPKQMAAALAAAGINPVAATAAAAAATYYAANGKEAEARRKIALRYFEKEVQDDVWDVILTSAATCGCATARVVVTCGELPQVVSCVEQAAQLRPVITGLDRLPLGARVARLRDAIDVARREGRVADAEVLSHWLKPLQRQADAEHDAKRRVQRARAKQRKRERRERETQLAQLAAAKIQARQPTTATTTATTTAATTTTTTTTTATAATAAS